uniref:Elongation of fatty acids protein n=1 Tax=Attheya septentrionalis TaxID=420275 RepID=A0A7S2UR25_9STRA|mmetsp:Transcript_8941/g.16280  ORF Transcript_8941/g.16280 Transcript_8941/m.16280 type:complete len:274 (+) Transcript_8941:125-946(+)|eukprot:CAMPEP_0198292486 /NCGR_PEP_ID=MMETSP1449-20131203/12238_1 /TAXON_ID=420275 /ORGANISM="Attheya septentrionalis, Strain CCMP2084" /LENGTH=273 /DNA_ID=CAMNT_0043991557 /DNA_START=100 /DNA_END=921 /DNA_ORIENTATION=+
MDTYVSTMDAVGESILSWADPDSKFRGYTDGWFLTDFTSAITIAIVYVVFVVVGSAIMKAGVPAMDPYPIKFVYNVSQIFMCAYMTVEAFLIAYRAGYHALPCNNFDTENPPLAHLLYLFYLSKVWDFWDTIFIVIGKKWRQLSFLHVYHHTTIFLFYWLNSHVNYDGDIYLTILLNGFIHTVMYTYYFICMHTKVPETGKSLPIWWKSSLTMMQLIQFVSMMSQATYLLVSGCEENTSRVTALYFVYILSLFFLFAQFYISSYSKPKKRKTN